MQTHVVHHLYPTIPHWDEPKALEALRPFLIERGVPGASDIPHRVRFNPLIARLGSSVVTYGSGSWAGEASATTATAASPAPGTSEP